VTSERKVAGADKRGRKIDDWRGIGSVGTIGFEIILCVAFGFFGGRWLDGKLGTAPYLEWLGFAFGLVAAIKAIMRAHGEMKRIAEQEEREQGNPSPVYDARDDERKNAAIEKDEARAANDENDEEDDADAGKVDR
jgi:ATP synthase protein I